MPLTAVSARTTVAVDATAVTAITGTLASDAVLDENAGGTITGIGDVNVTYTGNGALAALKLWMA